MIKHLTLVVVVLLWFCQESLSQSLEQRDSSNFAIVQVNTPQTVFSSFKILIFYGKNRVEEFMSLEYNGDNRDNLPNYTIDVLNRMDREGYDLKDIITYDFTNLQVQYIFKKKD